jgi:hypothetical protein
MLIYELFTRREPFTTRDFLYLIDENGEVVPDENGESIIAIGARSPLLTQLAPLFTRGRTFTDGLGTGQYGVSHRRDPRKLARPL